MIRLVTAIIVAGAVGAVAGALIVQNHYTTRLLQAEDLAAQLKEKNKTLSYQATAKIRRLEEEKKLVERQVARLERQNDALEEENALFHEQLEQAQRVQVAQASAESVSATTADTNLETDTEAQARQQQSDREREQPRQRPSRRIHQRRDTVEEDEEENRLSWRERIRMRVRERLHQLINAEIERVDDSKAKERLRALGEYVDYRTYVKQQLARTEGAERLQWQDELHRTQEDVRTLIEDQRRYMLEEVAELCGISEEDKREEVVQALQQLMNTHPLFRLQNNAWTDRSPRL